MIKHFLVVIVLTGAITLSLELLASRILTPYFGVSLFIWSGILSITLVSLALGYWWGGRLCHRAASENCDQLVFYFGLMPMVSSYSLVAACLLYPKLFLPLAKIHLIYGSFLACVILLFVPLVCLSAMNPILVALRVRAMKKQELGDAGAGFIFFISTMGSVAGVLATAFLLIPNMTNFRSVLLLAFFLSVLSMWTVTSRVQISGHLRRTVQCFALVGAALSIALFVGSDWYLKKNREIKFGDRTWKLLEEVPTFFANIKVVQMSIEFTKKGSNEKRTHDVKMYLTDGSIQSVVAEDGLSQSLYIYSLESLGRSINPRPRRILMLGLAGGCLPMRYAHDGATIDVVEINPVASNLARQHFYFDPAVASVISQDARVYVRDCQETYDLVFIDLYQSDSSVPEYLLTTEFVRDLRHLLSADGSLLFNVASSPNSRSHLSILKTIGAEMPELRIFHLDTDQVTNIIVVASQKPRKIRPAPLPNVPQHLFPPLSKMLSSDRAIDPNKLAAAEVITDDDNPFSFVNSNDMRRNRKLLLGRFPPELLVN